MRTAVASVLLALVAGGCASNDAPSTPTGCGMVPQALVAGLLGDDVDSTVHGTLSKLRSDHARASCRGTVPGHPERYLTVVADYHPAPVTSCAEGWVYAGTPAKYAPACQQLEHGHGVTQLIVRWQPYVMHITIGRNDDSWSGDPEIALAISRRMAQRLGVDEAKGDG